MRNGTDHQRSSEHQSDSKIQIATLMLLGGALSERGGVVHDRILFNVRSFDVGIGIGKSIGIGNNWLAERNEVESSLACASTTTLSLSIYNLHGSHLSDTLR